MYSSRHLTKSSNAISDQEYVGRQSVCGALHPLSGTRQSKGRRRRGAARWVQNRLGAGPLHNFTRCPILGNLPTLSKPQFLCTAMMIEMRGSIVIFFFFFNMETARCYSVAIKNVGSGGRLSGCESWLPSLAWNNDLTSLGLTLFIFQFTIMVVLFSWCVIIRNK